MATIFMKFLSVQLTVAQPKFTRPGREEVFLFPFRLYLARFCKKRRTSTPFDATIGQLRAHTGGWVTPG